MSKAPQSNPYSFEVKGLLRPLPVVVSKRRGARHMVLRYQPITGVLALTLPPYVSVKKGLQFLEEKHDWVVRQLGEHPERVPFACGQILPFLGNEYIITHIGGRGVVRVEDNRLLVPGEEAFIARRVRDWIKKQALIAISDAAYDKARILDCRIRKITLRDTRSLWGSCTSGGNLSFSWRIAFAPPEVLDYLVAHEVAHLKHLNHSAAFWRTVAELCPHWNQSRHWLKRHGRHLYAYG